MNSFIFHHFTHDEFAEYQRTSLQPVFALYYWCNKPHAVNVIQHALAKRNLVKKRFMQMIFLANFSSYHNFETL